MHDSRAWEFLFAIPCFLNSDRPSVRRYAFNLITNLQGIKKHYYVKFVYLSYTSKFRKCKKCRNNVSLRMGVLCQYAYVIWIKAMLFEALNFKRMLCKRLPNPFLITQGYGIRADQIFKLQLKGRKQTRLIRHDRARDQSLEGHADPFCTVLLIKILQF